MYSFSAHRLIFFLGTPLEFEEFCCQKIEYTNKICMTVTTIVSNGVLKNPVMWLLFAANIRVRLSFPSNIVRNHPFVFMYPNQTLKVHIHWASRSRDPWSQGFTVSQVTINVVYIYILHWWLPGKLWSLAWAYWSRERDAQHMCT